MTRRLATIIAAVLFGCGPRASSLPRPLPGTGRTPVEVQHFAAQPRFTSLYREGDPYAVVSLAAANGLGAGPNAALAAVVERRLRDREVDVRADGLALRISLPFRADARATLDALVSAVAAVEVTNEELEAARDAWQRRAPLPDPALEDWAHCTGAPGRARDEEAPDADALQRWLRQAFASDRLGLAYVGPADGGDAVAAALPTTRGWPRGSSEISAPTGSHRAFVGGGPRLRVGLYHHDAVAAVGAAQRLRSASPLAHHLALLDPPWVIASAGATAHHRGGCLHVELVPAVGAVAPEDGAEATALTEHDLRASLGRKPQSFAATREILAGEDVHETARRAAWWALTEPRAAADEPVVSVLRLGLSDTNDPNEIDRRRKGANAAYGEALRPAADAPAPELRLAIEPGQGSFWMLAAQPCALRDEGMWDAGHAALAAAALAGEASEDVTIEPWVTPDGVGLLAHAVPRHARERPAALARRVADALGQRLSALPTTEPLRRARHQVLDLLGDERANLLATAGERVAAGHPSWLIPWGLRDRVGDVEKAAVMARWRGLLLAGPWRVATLANADEAQAKAGVETLRRWLPSSSERCAAQEPGGPARTQGGPMAVPSVAAGATVLSIHPVDDLDLAQLISVAAQPRLDELGFDAGARVIEGPRPVLVLWGEGASVDRAAIVDTLQKLIETWTAEGIATDALTTARSRLASTLEASRRAPRERLSQLWRGREPAVPSADASTVSAWLQRTLRRGTMVVDR